MKLSKAILTSFMAATTLFATACGANTTSSTAPASQNNDLMVYRGSVIDTLEDGSIEVAQQPGFNYGYDSIVFHIDENTRLAIENGSPNQDAFVEVWYSGVLTRSIPPQGTAAEINVITTFTEGVIQNGTIKSVQKTDDGHTLNMLPMDAPSDERERLIVVHVSEDALEGITAEELVEGAQISVVTTGIATMSLPAQMSATVLTPYTT